MILLVVILHVLACISLILIVLLQAGKGADIGASMGGAGGQALLEQRERQQFSAK